MATSEESFSKIYEDVPNAKGKSFAIVVAEWNYNVTGPLMEGAQAALLKQGVNPNDIIIKHVPGTFELVFAAQHIMNNLKVDGIICLGCVIQGETPHFDFICQATSNGLAQLNTQKSSIPVIFGVLTTFDIEQALERAGGKLGNKGYEAALSAIKMAHLVENI